MSDKIDFNALAKEAAATAYDPRPKKRCWLLHNWSMWEPSKDGRAQGRCCLNCGKIQCAELEKVHAHTWEITSKHNIVAQPGGIATGIAYIQRCSGCGEMRRKDL